MFTIINLLSDFAALFGGAIGAVTVIGRFTNKKLFIGKLIRHMYLMKRSAKHQMGSHTKCCSEGGDHQISAINFKFKDKCGGAKEILYKIFSCCCKTKNDNILS